MKYFANIKKHPVKKASKIFIRVDPDNYIKFVPEYPISSKRLLGDIVSVKLKI